MLSNQNRWALQDETYGFDRRFQRMRNEGVRRMQRKKRAKASDKSKGVLLMEANMQRGADVA